MKPFSFTIDVARPVDDVFAHLTDPARLPGWQAGVVEVRHDPPMRPGSRLVEVRRAPGGRRAGQVAGVAAHEPGRTFDLRIVEGPIHVHGDHCFEPAAGGGTRIHVAGHGELPGPKRLLRPLLPLILERHHGRLKANLEA